MTPSARRPAPADDAPVEPELGYAAASQRPLAMLLFLLPLVLVYEVCLVFVLRSGDGSSTITVEAHRRIVQVFAEAGVAPNLVLSLGGVLIVAILAVWHLLRRDPWRVRGRTLALMTGEVVLLTVPLLVVGIAIAGASFGPAASVGVAPPLAAAPSGTGGGMGDAVGGLGQEFLAGIAISVGAGLYEELFFRMILVAAIHTLLVDLGGLREWIGVTIAVGCSAVAFTLYHDLQGPDGTLDLRRVVFFFVAGVYFGVLFLFRGYGIVVGVHALYDIATVLLASGVLSGEE